MESNSIRHKKGPKHYLLHEPFFIINLFLQPLNPKLLLLQQLEELIQLRQDNNACPAVGGTTCFS